MNQSRKDYEGGCTKHLVGSTTVALLQLVSLTVGLLHNYSRTGARTKIVERGIKCGVTKHKRPLRTRYRSTKYNRGRVTTLASMPRARTLDAVLMSTLADVECRR